MPDIPEELQRLWASRDRSSDVAVIPTITLEEVEEDASGIELDFLDEGELQGELRDIPSSSVITPSYSVTESVKVFPTYKITPQSIDLAGYESSYDKRF
jgi:hypothetical protein